MRVCLPVLLALACSGLFLEHQSRFQQSSVHAEGDSERREVALPAQGQTTERELALGRPDSYPLELQAGEYLHIEVEPRGIETKLCLAGPDGHTLIERDGYPSATTPVSLITQYAGRYRFEVRSQEKEQAQGRYALRVEIRTSKQGDDQTITTEQTFAEGEKLLRDWKAESSRKAIDRFQDSLSSSLAAADQRGQARALKRIGDVYQVFGQSEPALNYYNQARSLWHGQGDRGNEADVLNEIGYVYLNLGKNQIAEKLCTEALGLAVDAQNLPGKARALNNLGEVSYASGKLQESLEFFKRALPLWRESGRRDGAGLTLLNFGYTYSDVGQVREAFDYYNQALAEWTSAGNRRGQGMTLTAIGRLHSRMGESQEALSHFEQAREMIEAVGAPAELGRVFTGIAYVYDQLSDHEQAIDYYNRALPLFRATGDYSGEAATIYDAARAFHSLGQNDRALEYLEKALSISRAANDRRLQAFESRELGRVYASLKDTNKALSFLQKAAAFWKVEKDSRAEADTLNPIGQIYEERRESEPALAYYNRALSLYREAEYPVGEAAALYNIAHLERDRGSLDEARAKTEAGLAVVESLRTKVVSQDLRASYLASVRQHYELYIDVLMQLHRQRPTEGFDTRAFEISEKARARSLLESLKEARAEIREGVDQSLLERERLLEQALNAKARRHAELVTDKANAAEADKVASEIDQLSTDYQELQGQIKLQSPRYAALTQPKPLSLVEIQKQLLDSNTLLLEYALGGERSYVWAVTQTEVATFELPERAQLEDAALRFQKLLTANQPFPGETIAQHQDRVRLASLHLPEEAASFSNLVLGQVASKLGTKRLLIVADGALQYIPFQALVVPRAGNGNDAAVQSNTVSNAEAVPLIVDHEIVNEPSASALVLVRSETAQRKQAPNTLAVFANPVFETDDPRIKSKVGSGKEQIVQLQEGVGVRGMFRDAGMGEGVRIPALPASREEASAIMSMVPWRTGFKAEGFEASRATITRPELGQYRIVHFATHGFVNYQHPELSGLVLSLVDEEGKPQDGFLRMHDIYNLKLPADLVVLSACNTALGKDVKGEGLIGLTRGFMYAGASGVVASLWKVDDDATSELMTHFYEGMFKRSLTPAAALKEAQLAMWRQKRWHDSHYWAAFVIQGEYNQHVNSSSLTPAQRVLVFGILGSGLSLGVFLLLRRRRRRNL